VCEGLDTWWDLIRVVVDRGYEPDIAHNENDKTICYNYEFIGMANELPLLRTKEVCSKHLIVYDEFNRVINLHEIRQGIKEYIPRPEKFRRWSWFKTQYPFRYRYDPVPLFGHHHHGCWHGKAHTYRNGNIKAYYDLPDSRIKGFRDFGSEWDEDYTRPERNWKSQRKTQWK